MMTLDEMIGLYIKEVREEERMSQADLGRRVGDYLGKDWPRQTISSIERGERPLKAAEIVAICQILPIAPFTLLVPTEPVKLPSGRQLDPSPALLAGLHDEEAHDFVAFTKQALDNRLIRLEEFLSVVDGKWDSMVEGLEQFTNDLHEIHRARLDVQVGKEVDDES